MLGLVTEATNELLEVADDASKLDRIDVECEAMLLLGDIDQRQGRPTEAHDRLTEAERLASVADDPYLRVRVAFVLNTFVADHSGHLEQVIENLRSAIVTADEIHDHALVGEGHLRIASQLMSHDLAAAEAELRRCLKLAEDLHSRSWLLMAEALVATAAGESATATAAFAEALRLLEELDYALDAAEARFALARSLRVFGDVLGARVELERARATFVRVGADIRRDAIDRELEELVEGPAPTGPSTA